MLVHGFENFACPRNDLNDVRAISNGAFHLAYITTTELVLSLADMLASDAGAAQRFLDNLQVGHSRHNHFAERTRSAEDRLEHRRGVVLESTEPLAAHERAIEIPEEDAETRRH